MAELVRSLAAVMRHADVLELELDLGSLSLRLRRPASATGPAADFQRIASERLPQTSESREHVISAPMIGTYYSAPTPGASPFVTVGDQITSGQTIGIIEAMKIMNEIAADCSGIVQSIFVGNGQPVEYGSPLILLDISAGKNQ